MECLKCQLLKLGGVYRNSWIKRPNMTIPWLKQSQPIFTECLYIILKQNNPSLQDYICSRKEESVPWSGRWGMEAAEDSSGWGCCGLKTGSITNDGVTECKSLDPSWLQPQPGCLEASSAQGLHERFPSWLQPQPGRHGGKLCPGSPWEVPPSQVGTLRSCGLAQAHCANSPIRDSTEQVWARQGRGAQEQKNQSHCHQGWLNWK